MNIRKSCFFTTALLLTTVTLFSQQRVVLIEQFTNSGCPPCAANTPVIASYVNANPSSVVMLAYHTSFPYLDSMYHENPLQSDQRVALYNITGVPTSHVDGNYFTGNLVPALGSIISTRASIAPRYSINFNSVVLTNSHLTISAAFESVNSLNHNEPLLAHVVVAEKKVLKNSYVCCAGANAETEYPWVVRQMLPDAGGTTLSNTLIGGTDTLNLSWDANNFKDLSELSVIAFVQHAVTKEVYQAEMGIPNSVTGLSPHKEDKELKLTSFVNSSEHLLHLNILNSKLTGSIQIFNILGKEVYRLTIAGSTALEINTTSWDAGMYFVTLVAGDHKLSNRLIIQN